MDPLAALLDDVVGERFPMRRSGKRYDVDAVDSALDDFIVHARSGDEAHAHAAITALTSFRTVSGPFAKGYACADVDRFIRNLSGRYETALTRAAVPATADAAHRAMTEDDQDSALRRILALGFHCDRAGDRYDPAAVNAFTAELVAALRADTPDWARTLVTTAAFPRAGGDQPGFAVNEVDAYLAGLRQDFAI